MSDPIKLRSASESAGSTNEPLVPSVADELRSALTAAAEREETALSLLDSVRRDVTRLETLLADAQQDIRAAAERETKLREENGRLKVRVVELESDADSYQRQSLIDYDQREVAVRRAEAAEAEVERLTGELAEKGQWIDGFQKRALAQNQKVQALRWKLATRLLDTECDPQTLRIIEADCDALGLTADPRGRSR